MANQTLFQQLVKEEQPDLSLLCYLAKKTTPTPSLISAIFLPFFKRLSNYAYEIQIQLSEVYGIHGSNTQPAYWLNNTELIPVVAHHWLMNQLMVTPQEAINNHSTYQIKNALHQINCNTRQQLEQLLDVLQLQEKVYDNEVITLLENGIKNGNLTYEQCKKTLFYLLTSTEYEIVFSACELMKKHPFIFPDAPEVSLRRVMQKGECYEPLALQTLGIWGNNRIFEDVIQGESWQLESKRAVLPYSILTSPLVDKLAHYLTVYPTYSSDWLSCLLRGANEGIYIAKNRIQELVAHYFEYEFISARQLVQLTEEKSTEELLHLSVRYNDFQKHIKLYQELNTSSSRNRIVTLLKKVADSDELNILLDTITELKITEAEPYIFTHIQNHPKRCFETLKQIGSSKTISHLKKLLEFDAPVKQNIPSFERGVLTLLADLVPDHQMIIDYLERHELPHINLPNLHLGVVNESYLLKILDQEEASTVEYSIEKLGEFGSLETLEPIIKKIGAIEADFIDQEWEHTNSAWEASKKIANRAYSQHKIRAKKRDQKTVVNTLLTEVLLKQLHTPLSDAHAKIYLSYVSEVIPNNFSIEKLALLVTSTNPHIIKFYISYLGKINTDTAVRQLKKELKITQNIYTLRQAILALTELKNASLEHLVIPLLQHPNMNIKKTAANYLSENGTVKAVVAMINLMQRNDNSGLRAELERGLKNILGNVYHFFLFNECFPCEVSWQRQLLENIINNDDELTERHYIDFPELNTVAPLEKIVANPKKDQELITKWKTARKRAKEDLARFEKSEDLVIEIKTIKRQADFVFITDLIASKFRVLEKAPVHKEFDTVLTTEEARLALTENNSNSNLWNTLLLDSENEQTEYNNLLDYKEGKEKLFFHFLSHYGFQKTVSRLIEKKQVTFLKKLLSNHQIAHPKYLPLLINCFDRLKNQNEKNITELLETIITTLSFSNKNHQTVSHFITSNREEKINKLFSFCPQQQSLLKKEIVQLYKSSSWKDRNTLLRTIKTPKNHTELFELSFINYLEGKEVSPTSFSLSQIQLIEKHPEAIEHVKRSNSNLSYHSNSFIRSYVKEISSDQEAVPNLLSSFRRLDTVRKWEILKPEITKGNYYWFGFFDEFNPINSELLNWFREASTEGRLEFIKRLSETNKLYFPLLDKELLLFIKEAKEPIVWLLLFRLSYQNIESVFVSEYETYTATEKVELLTHFLHNLSNKSIPPSIFKTLVPTDKKEEILLIQLQLKTLDHNVIDTDLVISLIKQLTNRNNNLAKQSLAEVIEINTDIGLEKQMVILSACYSITELNNLVTTQIAHLFSTELLTLSFLTEDHKNQFLGEVGKLIKQNNTEIDKKGLLKNLADDSPKEIKPLLMDLLSSKKKTDLDTLCLRLLKKTSSKAVYLETCHHLLSSEKENLFKSIIRTLSFAKYTPAIPVFIKLLSHKNLSKDARNALLIIGQRAISLLTKEVNKVRPDKRNELDKIIEEIENL